MNHRTFPTASTIIALCEKAEIASHLHTTYEERREALRAAEIAVIEEMLTFVRPHLAAITGRIPISSDGKEHLYAHETGVYIPSGAMRRAGPMVIDGRITGYGVWLVDSEARNGRPITEYRYIQKEIDRGWEAHEAYAYTIPEAIDGIIGFTAANVALTLFTAFSGVSSGKLADASDRLERVSARMLAVSTLLSGT